MGRRHKQLFLLLAGALLLLAACGNDTPPGARSELAGPTPAAPSEKPAQPTAAPTTAPAEKPAPPAAPAAAQPVGGDPALTVEQVASIETYRMHVEVASEGKPSVLVEMAHVKTPLAEDNQVTLYQNGEPIQMNVRFINDVLYLSNGETWSVISNFNLAELTVITPGAMAAAAPDLTLVGEEEMSGRRTLHLRGDKSVIPDIQAGSDSLSVKGAEAAQLDLWLDAEERFIVKLLFSLTIEGKTFTTEFLYYDFNTPIVVEVPTNIETVAAPPTPTPSEIMALLGFDFPIPDGSQLSVVARTANILTPMSVAEARTHLEEAMTTAGFSQVGDPVERAKDEFFYTFQRDERTVTANVFSVVAGKTTIQIGAAK
ncbi:MAG: hypothetical protein KJZ86_17515 [Caldilineaceae bacterium]|nr:hypothetical protein [Caldilineaceae bacterium]